MTDRDETYELSPGELVDLDIRQTNADPDAFAEDPLQLRPDRERAKGAQDVGLSFGFGAHGCPGQPLALRETDALLHRLLSMDVIKRTEPSISWDDLIEGYKVRGLTLEVR